MFWRLATEFANVDVVIVMGHAFLFIRFGCVKRPPPGRGAEAS